MAYYYNNYDYNRTHNQLDPRVVMATSAMAAGMVAVALSFTVYLAIILGGISIMLALLSRDSAGKLLPQAKRGLIFGMVAAGIGYYLMISSLIAIFTDPATHEYMNQTSQAMTGQTFDELLEGLGRQYGIDLQVK